MSFLRKLLGRRAAKGGRKENSLGYPIASITEALTAFWTWFGKSLCVDDTGRPLVVYRGQHGSAADIESMHGAISFSDDSEIASLYAQEPNQNGVEPKNPKVFAGYLKIENPVINQPDDPFVECSHLVKILGYDEAYRLAIKYKEDVKNTDNWAENFSAKYQDVKDCLDADPKNINGLYFQAYHWLDDVEEVTKLLVHGFDGAIHLGSGAGHDTIEYKVFDVSQIKSVWNNGEFKSKTDITATEKWREDATPEQIKTVGTYTGGALAMRGPAEGVPFGLDIIRSTESVYQSAEATFNDFEVLPGVYLVPTGDLSDDYSYSDPKEVKRIAALAEQIRSSQEIVPLFVAIEPIGIDWVVEGQHRLRALVLLGFTHFPAKVILSMDITEATAADKELIVTPGNIEQEKDLKCIGYTYIDPKDFLDLTFHGAGAFTIEKWIEREKAEYIASHGSWRSLDDWNAALQPGYTGPGKMIHMPWLTVQMEDGNNGRKKGQVVGHEGRHRAVACIEAGATRMPIAILLKNKDGYSEYYTGGTPPNYKKRYLGVADVPDLFVGEFNHSNTWKFNAEDFVSFYPGQTAETARETPDLNAAFRAWFGKSKIVDADGTPKVMYHGTSRDFSEFKAKQAGAVFLTDDPKFAESFSDASIDYMVRHADDFLAVEQLDAIRIQAQKDIRKNHKGAPKTSIDGMVENFFNTDEFLDLVRVALEAAPHIMPLYVRCEKPFDYESKDDIAALVAQCEKVKYTPDSFAAEQVNWVANGHWDIIERPAIQSAFKAIGCDGFWVKEGGVKNLAVYSPNQVKSATGNDGHWSRTNNDITASTEELTPAAVQVMEKYKGEQASNEPIREFMEAQGLTLEDYKAANELYYSHNVSSGGATESRIVSSWHEDSPLGKAMRAMSKWQEWQVEHTKLSGGSINMEAIRKRVTTPGYWEKHKNFVKDGQFFDNAEDYLEYLEAEQRGEWMFYRKGPLDAQVISMTTDPDGARSGSSHFVPDRVMSFKQMKDAGYSLLAGARGMVGVTSSQEREYIWLKTTSTKSATAAIEAPDTPAFRKWFGDSKCTKEGKPLVVYHGTTKDIISFRTAAGTYFSTNPAYAGEYAGSNGHVMAVFLSVTNPLEVTNDEYWAAIWDDAEVALLDKARGLGHDGLVIRNFEDFGSEAEVTGDMWVTFKPQQVKSATGNNGDFDPGSKDITAAIEAPDTPQFKKWFGASKVVDTAGKPMVVYHGTLRDFEVFDRMFSKNNLGRNIGIDTMGSWFSTNPSSDDGAGMYGDRLYPVFLAITNPWVATFSDLTEMAIDKLPKGAKRKHGPAEVDQVRDELKHLGYDGIKVVHNPDNNESTEFLNQDAWIAFEPEQIKSATGNNGDFDPTNKDITAAIEAPDTPEFQKWFGDSKVVDHNDRPLVVFHGAAMPEDADIDQFNPTDKSFTSSVGSFPQIGTFFTESADIANSFPAMWRPEETKRTYPVFLSVKNPKKYKTFTKALTDFNDNYGGRVDHYKKQLQAAGYDGITYAEGPSWGGKKKALQAPVWVVFEPGQIKSATGNNGAFDPKSKDITAGVDIPVVYHGTDEDFSNFDFAKAKDGAHWFTPSIRHAAFFGVVRAYRLLMTNPLVIDQKDLDDEWDKDHPEEEPGSYGGDDRLPRDYVGALVQQARDSGHDGLIIENFVDLGVTGTVYLPFSADQIQLAEESAASASIDTPAFKAWFKQSKIVGQDDQPQVVFHGSPSASEIRKGGFDPQFLGKGNDQYGAGFYFTSDEKLARGYLDGGRDRDTGENKKRPDGHEPGVVACYLSLQKPVYIKDDGNAVTTWEQFPPLTRPQIIKLIKAVPGWDDPDGVLSNFGDARREGLQKVLDIVVTSYLGAGPWALCNDWYDDANTEFLRQYHALTGYDGVVVANGKNTLYVAWFPEQIKAVDNDGTWDSSDRSILSSDHSAVHWVQPDFEREWDEAQRYPESFPTMGRWLQACYTGRAKVLTADEVKTLGNHTRVEDWDQIPADKRNRVADQFGKGELPVPGEVEMPIVIQSPTGLELVAGNTRLTYCEMHDVPCQVWFIRLSLLAGETTAAAGDASKILEAEFPELKFYLSGTYNDSWSLSQIIVPKGERSRGAGSKFMTRLCQLADEKGATLVLTPADRGDGWGTTSRGRLIQFYKRFGFVENKGRNKDYKFSDMMIRRPGITAAAGDYDPATDDPGGAHSDSLRKTGFWGSAGAGCIVVAKNSGRILIGHRSGAVLEPGTWGTWGGAINSGSSPEETAVVELIEETGYTHPVEELVPLLVFKSGSFQYFNFLAVVESEFTPHLNWENQGYKWVHFGDWPKPLHPGLKALFADTASMTTIEQHSKRDVPAAAVRPIMPPKRIVTREASDSRYGYHATSVENFHGIVTDGLKIHNPSDYTDQNAWPDGGTEKRAYFASSFEQAMAFAPNDTGWPVMLRIHKDSQDLKREQYTGDMFAVADVPAKDLEYLGEDDHWHQVLEAHPDAIVEPT